MIDPQEFKAALGRFASGVTIVTIRDDEGEITGLTANAFCSVSLEPPMVLVCVHAESQAYPLFGKTGHFAIHILAEHQSKRALAFATKGRDKAVLGEWRLSERNIPVLSDYNVLLECRLAHEYPGGTHSILVGEVKHIHIDEKHDKPLLYYRGKFGGLPEELKAE